MILPVNDWKAIKNIHFQVHVLRAIENGVPLVRAAASGLSVAIDPWGRVLSVSDFYAAGDRTMTAQVPSPDPYNLRSHCRLVLVVMCGWFGGDVGGGDDRHGAAIGNAVHDARVVCLRADEIEITASDAADDATIRSLVIRRVKG